MSVTTIPCLGLKMVFECLGIYHINFFFLHVKGGELSVLESIDFAHIKFDVICVETDPNFRYPGHRLAVTDFLQKQGYKKEIDRGRNTWFRHKDFQGTSKSQARGPAMTQKSSTT